MTSSRTPFHLAWVGRRCFQLRSAHIGKARGEDGRAEAGAGSDREGAIRGAPDPLGPDAELRDRRGGGVRPSPVRAPPRLQPKRGGRRAAPVSCSRSFRRRSAETPEAAPLRLPGRASLPPGFGKGRRPRPVRAGSPPVRIRRNSPIGHGPLQQPEPPRTRPIGLEIRPSRADPSCWRISCLLQPIG